MYGIAELKSHWWNVNCENIAVPFVRAGLPLLVMNWQVIRALSVPWKGSHLWVGEVHIHRTTNTVGRRFVPGQE